ncbi:MAG: ATPase domain-containing protein [Candidatus Hodarchaeota archaeon]
MEKLPSMNEYTLKRLHINGIFSNTKLAAADLSVLIKWGIPGDRAKNLIDEALVVLKQSGFGFKMGNALKEDLDDNFILKTGCKSLDQMLDGGFHTKKLFEIYGPEKVGKTNFLFHMLCKAMQTEKKGGLDCPVIYVDSERNFSINKVKSIAPRFGLDPDYVIDNTYRLKVTSSEEMLIGLEQMLIPQIEESGARVILVDSIIANVRAEYVGQEKLPERQGLLGKYTKAIDKAIEKFNAVAIIVNQVTSKPSDDDNTSGIFHAGGNVLGHNVQVRIQMRFAKDSSIREFYLEKNVDKKPVSCYLKLMNDGYHDVK